CHQARQVPRRMELYHPSKDINGQFILARLLIADNYAPFYSVPIECTERDAPYVLDGLLYHESELDPQEHYTDTHGYIELNFPAFPMFGKRFCPRIRGLHHQWIYRIDQQKAYGPLTPLVSQKKHIPPNYVVKAATTQRKPPEVRICRLRNQSAVGTRPPSTSTPHWPACMARR